MELILNALSQRKKAKEINTTNFMSLWCGQSAMLCRDIKAADLIYDLVTETKKSLANNAIDLKI